MIDAPPPAVHTVNSTAYCLKGQMADGSRARPKSVASNRHRLGTRLKIKSGKFKGRVVVVRDRIGYGTELDFWMPSCSAARKYGMKRVRYSVVPEHKRKPTRRLYFKDKVSLAYSTASNAWPGSPCGGREVVKFDPATIAQQYPDYKLMGVAAIADPWDGTCAVHFSEIGAQTSLRDFCNVLTHEFGHLSGVTEHRPYEPAPAWDDPMRTMTEVVTPWKGCENLEAPKGTWDPYDDLL